MKKGEFLYKIEKYRPIIKGNGMDISKLAAVEYDDYTYAINGRKGNEELLLKIYNAIINFSNKVIAEAA